ncbi:hypothetical protein RISK_005776 [Rhodopirellula islandica]|uniref:Uncharacterized protein n=1 Tax=Rhodopirellula islandica TaxID=595434 RepID=A0A0J1B7B1_RHOIS|nr:hypothetical protein RISK_005776 [Rhodopirellula islandica]
MKRLFGSVHASQDSAWAVVESAQTRSSHCPNCSPESSRNDCLESLLDQLATKNNWDNGSTPPPSPSSGLFDPTHEPDVGIPS